MFFILFWTVLSLGVCVFVGLFLNKPPVERQAMNGTETALQKPMWCLCLVLIEGDLYGMAAFRFCFSSNKLGTQQLLHI